MRYRIIDLDIAGELPELRLASDEHGVAVVMRLANRPVGFEMIACPPGSDIEPSVLREAIAREVGVTLVRRAVRDELVAGSVVAASLPSLSVAVCTKDRPAWLERCVKGILRLRDSAHGGVLTEILVVDNAPSDDRTARVVATLPGVRYLREPRPGLDFARNLAWREAGADFVAYIDDDAVVDPCWLDGFVEAWRVHDDAGAFTGLVLPLALDTEAQVLFERRGGFRRGFDWKRFVGSSVADMPWYPAGSGNFGVGCNMILRRSLLRDLGGFDEALDTGAPLPGGGDLDIFYRVVRAGAPLVYEPGLLVFHEHRREMSQLRRQYYTWGLGFMAYVAKTWRVDPTQRRTLLYMTWRWSLDLARATARAVVRRNVPPSHLLAEAWGGIVGATGEYSRSERRIRRLSEAHVGDALARQSA